MATKTLTITEDAYDRLASVKGKKESFSNVIVKHFPKRSLMELAGILTNAEANKLRKHVQERRKSSCERVDRMAERLR